LNVSKFGPRLAGAGGFINISQNAKRYVCRQLYGWPHAVGDRRRALRIIKDGNQRNFVNEVEHRTFSGSYAVKRGQPVLYITERCVFELTPDGLELTEVAPGTISIEIFWHRWISADHSARSRTHGQAHFLPEPMGYATICCA
jgi:propionate CoA-transferase